MALTRRWVGHKDLVGVKIRLRHGYGIQKRREEKGREGEGSERRKTRRLRQG